MGEVSYSNNPCKLFIDTLKSIVDIADKKGSITKIEVNNSIHKHLGSRNWYPERNKRKPDE